MKLRHAASGLSHGHRALPEHAEKAVKQALATLSGGSNLAIFPGVRHDVATTEEEAKGVFTDLLLAADGGTRHARSLGLLPSIALAHTDQDDESEANLSYGPPFNSDAASAGGTPRRPMPVSTLTWIFARLFCSRAARRIASSPASS